MASARATAKSILLGRNLFISPLHSHWLVAGGQSATHNEWQEPFAQLERFSFCRQELVIVVGCDCIAGATVCLQWEGVRARGARRARNARDEARRMCHESHGFRLRGSLPVSKEQKSLGRWPASLAQSQHLPDQSRSAEWYWSCLSEIECARGGRYDASSKAAGDRP